MGRFLDEAPQKTYKGKFLDEGPMSPNDNSIYSKGGDWDLKKKLGRFSSGPKLFGVPLAERVMSGSIGGVAPSVSGAMNLEDAIPGAFQTIAGFAKLNPLVGSLTSTAASTAGQVVRQGAKAARGYKPSFDQVLGEVPRTFIPEMAFRSFGSALAPAANKLMINTAKVPTTDVIKNPNIGLKVLDQGVWGTKTRMAKKLGENVRKYEKFVRDNVRGSSEKVELSPIEKRLTTIKSDMKTGLHGSDVSGVDDILAEFKSQFPTKDIDVETGQFVMGPASKQVSPQLTGMQKTKIARDVPALLGKKRFDSIRLPSGKFGRSSAKAEILTDMKYLDSPEDIVALNIPSSGAKTQRIVTASPKTNYSIRPQTVGPSIKKRMTIPDYEGMPFEQGLDIKKAIYSETPEAAFNRTMSELPSKQESRRAIAQEINKQIKNKVPGVVDALDSESAAITYKDALVDKMINEGKHLPLGKLPGMGAFGAAFSGRPDVASGVLFGNALVGGLRSGLSLSGVAKLFYQLSKMKKTGIASRVLSSELLRGLTQT